MRQMRKIILTAALPLVLFCAAAPARPQNPAATPAPAHTAKPAPAPPAWLDRRVRDEVAKFEGTVSLYAKNLDTGAEYSFGGDERVRTASTIKVAVMIEAFARVAGGKA